MKKILALSTTLLAFNITGCANNPELMETATRMATEMATSGGGSSVLSNSDIAAGLKDALRVGSKTVVAQLGAADGFNADPKIRIPLPDSLLKARKLASQVGLDGKFADLETKLNRAAEASTPKAKALFMDAIEQMSLTDAKGILSGPDNAATQYFQNKMKAPLAKEMQPIVNSTMSQVGAISAYDSAMGALGPAAALLPDYRSQLTDYVVEKGMSGIFTYLAVEEAAIRKNPLKRTTEILRKVFGQ